MIKLLGIPFDSNSCLFRGPAIAPKQIRLMQTLGSMNSYAENGVEIENGTNYSDIGDIDFTDNNPENAFNTIRAKILNEISNSNKILCMGGDHSITFPIVDAYTNIHKNLNILQFDAHPDLYDNYQNNPFSHASPFARIMEKGNVKSLTQVGIRTFNTHQRKQAEKFSVKLIEMKNFNFEFIKELKEPLYITIDLDVLDPAFAPGVSHHEPGGLTTRELISIIQKIDVPIVGADVVEFNPARDVNNVTATLGYKLIKELISKMIG